MTDAPERIWVSETPGQNWPHPEERRGAWTTNVGQYGNEVEYIRADLCRPEAQGWQPIETAPRDGTRVLIHSPETHTYTAIMAAWCLIDERWEEWGDHYPCEPTHWMHLPAPPAP